MNDFAKRARAAPARKVRLAVCPGCSALTLFGLDADIAACPVRADYARLSGLGELLALAGGRTTYEITRRGTRYEFDPREARAIARAGPETVAVVAEHRCAEPLPATWIAGRRVLQSHRRAEIPNEPAF